MKLATSLTNMFGEFIAIQKSPEFKPSSASMQELNRAIKEEKKEYKMKSCTAARPRYHSAGDMQQQVSTNPDGGVTMRSKSGVRRSRPSSLVERIVMRFSPSRATEVIREEDECDTRKLSTRSEKLHLTIV